MRTFEELEAKYDDMCFLEYGETCNGCKYNVDGMNCSMMFAYEQGAKDMERAKQIIIDTLLKEIEQCRTEVLDEVMKKAEEMQLEQIENLDKSIRRNGKMWAGYMITYLGHIQAACKRMLEDK